jgi:hypothetical protein
MTLGRRVVLLGCVALALPACAPRIVHEPVPRTDAPQDFPAHEYAEMARRGVRVFAVDGATSRILIEVGKAGRLAHLGHEHAIVARDVHGYVAPQAGRADLYVRVDTLAVDESDARREAGFDTEPTADAIAGTRENMLRSVFDVEAHPFVRVRAVRVGAGVPDAITISVNGVQRTVPVTMQREDDEQRFVARGRFSVNQSDFGITPFSILGGALQVRDRVDIRFTIEARAIDRAP